MAPGVNMLVTLEGSQLLTKLGNQQAIPIFPESEMMFFAKVVDAKIEFAKPNAEGVPGQLILHQNGRDQPDNRLSEVEFKQVADAAAAVTKRFKDQTQDPRTEVALRRDIEELRLGQPKYEMMSPGLADVTRQQLPQLKATITQLGAVAGGKLLTVSRSEAPSAATTSRDAAPDRRLSSTLLDVFRRSEVVST